ncbi:hypothetical protein BWI93_18390 [Siphonobacter sp. BAB-5385]|uniref:LIC_10190 family membrane protein n=1 Tax=Siphonobacter sp. BAB-5385 TaxID=1864822 RepID=UPI000B9DD52D|nr:hypothetical protein [Siphonobacter sp. BAB-5385]OZI06753.1 hypothetical protein BWI93_18390 [Siphonobacter sp. BAB-5385]
MLITLLLWLYISLLCLLAGDLVRMGFQKLGRTSLEVPLPFLAILGWAGLMNGLGYGWLLVPVGQAVHLLILTGLLIGGWVRRNYWLSVVRTLQLPRSWLFWVVSLLGFLVILTRTTHLPRVADTGGYHAPMIRWISEYAVVPGLANVNYRFGFNNASFLTEAFFSLRFLGGDAFHVLNGWLMAVVWCWALLLLRNVRFKPSEVLIVVLGVWYLWHSHWRLASPSPDHPAQLLVGLLFFLLIRQMEAPANPSERLLMVWLTLLAFTIKMSTLVALLIPLLLFVDAFRKKDYAFLPRLIAVGLLPLLWWLTANVILTGYILYPTTSPLLDWFSFDWKVPKIVIEQGLLNLSGGTKLSPVQGLFDFSWVPYWFTQQLVPDQLLLVCLFGWPLFASFRWKKTVAFLMQYPNWFWVLVTAYAGVAFWFITAPEFRFGMGFIIAALVVGYLPYPRAVPALYRFGIVGVLSLALLYASFKRQASPLVFPDAYPAAQLTSYPLQGQRMYVATDDPRVIHGIKGYWSSCQDAALPCSPYYNPSLRLRGTTLSEGFKAVETR